MTATIGTRHAASQATLDRLKRIVGPAGFIDDPRELVAYCSSWRGNWVGRVPLLLRPASTAEVQEIVRVCAEARLAIVPQGGNTGLTGASQPHDDGSEIIVSTARMKQIREIDTENDTITVEAGVVLKDIQDAAGGVNRLFPLSLGAEGSCQIGGNISTNAGGIQVLRYGNTRNLVLGLEVVLADGQLWDGLRALRKDNTGYDLKQLFIGGEGSLGIITAAVLKLFPKPSEQQTAFIAVEGPEAGVKLLGFMREAFGDSVTSFELIRRSIIDFLLAGVPGHSDPLASVHPWYVLMEIADQGAPGTLHEPLAEALERAMESGLVTDAVIANSGEQAKKLWKMREDLAEAQKSAGGSIAHDISVPLSRIAEFIRRADAAVEKAYPGVRHCSFGHVGDGNLHYNPVRPTDWTYERFAAETANVNRLVHDIVVELGGSISAEHGIGRLRLAENIHYKSPVEVELMRRIKRAFDPDNILNPGK
ncbi:MAG: FAD-binding oxidoreductase, partial [Hyphomicrobiaceae bacterium]|nr:FAD-binding oxidoreductase [Hyphomicrobiaceae bacterium]